jgi:hypothetical protein
MTNAEHVDELTMSGPRHALRKPGGKADAQSQETASAIVARYIADEGGVADGIVQSHVAES